jgi:gas vesicle protein
MTSDPDQIRGNIEQTQQNLSANVDALTEKVSPPKIMQRRVQQTRSSMTNVKDRIMGSTAEHTSNLGGTVSSSASSAKDTVASTASSAKDTVASTASSAADAVGSAPDLARQRTRGNPLAAGLIAFGAGWLVASLLPATEPEQQVAAQVKDVATEQGRPVAQQLSQAGQEAAQELKDSAQQRAQSVKETATDAASTVRDEAQSQASDVTDHAQDARGRVTDQAGSGGS